jgi:hypothetical protein
MEKHVRGLERHNLHELEAVERLANKLGSEAFLAVAMELASGYTIDPEECRQSIRKKWNPTVIGMTAVPFQALAQVCESLIQREPKLLGRLPYRCRNEGQTALPLGLWQQLAERARTAKV